MQKQIIFPKIAILGIILLLASCSSSNSKVWDRYHKLNDIATTPTSSRLHNKYFEMNDNTDSHFTYSSAEANLK